MGDVYHGLLYLVKPVASIEIREENESDNFALLHQSRHRIAVLVDGAFGISTLHSQQIHLSKYFKEED